MSLIRMELHHTGDSRNFSRGRSHERMFIDLEAYNVALEKNKKRFQIDRLSERYHSPLSFDKRPKGVNMNPKTNKAAKRLLVSSIEEL